MDFLKKNVFVSICLGVNVVAVAAVATIFLTKSPAAQVNAYKALEGGLPTKVVSEGDVKLAEKAAAERQKSLVELETAVTRRALGLDVDPPPTGVYPTGTAVYLVYWGNVDKTVAVNREGGRPVSARVTLDPPGTERFPVRGLTPDADTGLQLASVALVDPDGSDKTLAAWRERHKGEKEFGFILLPRTLHGLALPEDRDKNVAEAFRDAYLGFPNSVRGALKAYAPESKIPDREKQKKEIDTDRKAIDELRRAYQQLRDEHATWVRDCEWIEARVQERRSGGKEKAPERPVWRADMFDYKKKEPDLNPGDLYKRMLARTTDIYWADNCIHRDPWTLNVAGRLPTAAEVFTSQSYVWLVNDVVAAVKAVNSQRAAGAPAAFDPVKDKDLLAKWGAKRTSWLDQLEAAPKKPEGAAPGMPMAGNDLTKPDEPKSPLLDDVFDTLADPKKAADPMNHAANPRQGVMGSDVKMLLNLAFYVDAGTGLPFIPPMEPLVPEAEAAAGGQPAPAAPAAGAPAAQPAAAADGGAAPASDPVAFIRRRPRPAPGPFEDPRPKTEERAGGPFIDYLAPRKLSLFGVRNLSITDRGGTNDYFVMHFAVQVLATPKGVDSLIRAIEGRRFYTLARPPELRPVNRLAPPGLPEAVRARFPYHDLGSEPVVEAALYFESVIYHSSLRQVVDARALTGNDAPAAPAGPLVVSLMPNSLWYKYLNTARAAAAPK
jgi:hypothetical protein